MNSITQDLRSGDAVCHDLVGSDGALRQHIAVNHSFCGCALAVKAYPSDQ